ncbi:MAG TPA: outer membrane beta-barrel protein [Steroidobacteraceae bacterium]|jgi:hypothetical protein
MRFSRGLSFISLLAVGGLAHAADAPADAKPTGPSLADVLTASGVTVSGYVDAMYDYSSSPAPALQEFTGHHSSFLLDQASLSVAYQPKEGFGAVAQVIAGEDGRILNESSPPTSDGPIDITQAFVQYASGNFTIQGGKMLTLVGAEVIAPTGNTNVSRSLLFFGEPLTHTGLRATVALNDQVSLIFGVNNGWNATSDTNTGKTAELGLAITPSKSFALTLQGYSGSETAPSGLDGNRTIIDGVATFTVNDSLSLVLSADWGKQKNAFGPGQDGKWSGVAGYFNYALPENWRISVRAEYMKDSEGYFGGVPDQKYKEVTVTLGYAPTKNFELRLEGRVDKSTDDVFLKDTDGSLSSNQAHFLIEGLYKFPAPTG